MKFIKNKLINLYTAILLVPCTVYADTVDLPTGVDIEDAARLATAVQPLIDFLNTVLNILVALGAVSCIGAGIWLGFAYAIYDDPKEIATIKGNFIKLACTTLGIGGIRLITAVIVALLGAV